MGSNVYVTPSADIAKRVSVATEVIDGVHYPIYKENPLAGLVSASATVTTAGTRIQLPANTIRTITIKGKAANVGIIYVGSSDVTASNGFPIAAGDTISLDLANSDLVWLDSSVSGEGVNWIAGT
jgi:hypothetical protein